MLLGRKLVVGGVINDHNQQTIIVEVCITACNGSHDHGHKKCLENVMLINGQSYISSDEQKA